MFVSYSGRESPAVAAIYGDLQRSRHTVWLDHEIRGGETWWQAIVAEIRRCEVFVIAVSEMSMASQACLAELDYARTLGKPVVPVLVESVASMRTLSISDTQVVDYRSRTADTVIALLSAVTDAATRGRPMPSPLPPEPPMPYGYLQRMADIVDDSQLSPAQQVGLLAELRHTWQIEREEIIRREIVALVMRLRNRPDVTYGTATEIDSLLSTIGAPPSPSPRYATRPTPRPTPRPGATAVRDGATARRPVPWQVKTVLGVSAFLAAFGLIGVVASPSVSGLITLVLFLVPLVGAIGTRKRMRWGRRTAVISLVIMALLFVGVSISLATTAAAGSAPAGQLGGAAVIAVLGLGVLWTSLLLRHASVREYLGH